MTDRLAELIRQYSNPQQIVDTIRRAAQTDEDAERWLRERGISLEIGTDPFPPNSNGDN